MKFVGAHVSATGGVENAPINAHEIGAKAFALFTKNQRQWFSSPLTKENIQKFKENCAKYGFNPGMILPHDSYLINLGNPAREPLEQSRKSFLDEMKRCELLGLKLTEFPPGFAPETVERGGLPETERRIHQYYLRQNQRCYCCYRKHCRAGQQCRIPL